MFINIAQADTFTPVAGTQVAARFDELYAFLLIISTIASLLVIGGMIYFALKYKRNRENEPTGNINHNGTLEFLWSFIPFVLFMIVFGWGWYVYHGMRSLPKDALEVHVTGKKWAWEFTYKSGRKTTAEFVVPVNKPVKLIMTSQDVIHSFYIPAFRIKQDVVPGRYTAMWFEADKVGDFNVFCTEYCGASHWEMLAKVKVLPVPEYEEWLQNDPYKGLSLAEVGQKVYQTKCMACHNTSDQRLVGPGFKGLWGAQREFTDGGGAIADESYIRESIMYPAKHIVAGYQNLMTPWQLPEDEMLGIIEFIKNLGPQAE